MMGVAQSSGVGRAVDNAAAGVFAMASGYSAQLAFGSIAGAGCAAAGAFLGARLLLSLIDETPPFRLPQFAVGQVKPEAPAELPELLLTELSELLLTEVAIAPGTAANELLLEDRLVGLDAESRVIRLFDPRTLPAAGDLHEPIKRQRHGRDSAPHPDATAELHRALADLRRTLR